MTIYFISKNFFCETPKDFATSQVPGTEMKFIAVEKQVSIVFGHVTFCVTQAETSLKNDKTYEFNDYKIL